MIEAPSTPAPLVIGLLVSVLLAIGISVVVAMVMARRTAVAVTLRSA